MVARSRASPRGIRRPELPLCTILHIDLLPGLQGRGFGRALIDAFRTALAARGVPGVHLGMDAANAGARAFHERLGFHELPSSRPRSPLLGIATAGAGSGAQ